MISAKELHDEGLRLHIEEHNNKETIGTFRGGNTGMLINGQAVGDASACPRRAFLRSIGTEVDPTTLSNQIMFDGGLANEDYFFDRVGKAWALKGGSILSAADYPSKWFLRSGRAVTGSPDGVLVLGDAQKVPVLGVELKGIFSLWTARDVLEGKPKIGNLMQAAHYMYALGLKQYELVYVNRSYFAANEMAARLLPNYGGNYQEYLDYRFYHWRPKVRGSGMTRASITEEEYRKGVASGIRRVDTGTDRGSQPEFQADIGNIKPFCISFAMRTTTDGFVEIRETTQDTWNKTVVNWQGIKDYYEQADSLYNLDATLPPAPKLIDVYGGKKGYSSCQYCPLKSVCGDGGNKKVVDWLKKVEQYTDSINVTKPSGSV